MDWKLNLVAGLLTLLSTQGLGAQILSEAMLAFPASTESLEVDNLATLRTLRNYDVLKDKFGGKPLEQVKAALAHLGVQENQVSEIAMGSSPGAFFGLVSGSFSGAAVYKMALKKGPLPTNLDGGQMYCPPGGTCILFLEDSLAGFGTSGQLSLMMQARQGVVARLSSKRDIAYLLNKTNPNAPVRGMASGSQLTSAIQDALQDQSGLNIDWSQFSSNVNAFGYSVSMDSRAHVSATLECKSATTAALLRQMLGTLGGLQSMAARTGSAASMPFQNMQVSSSGNMIDLKMDTAVPTA